MIPVARLSVRLAGQNVGQLGLGERGRIYFQYDPDWIARGFDLAPGSLDFNPSVQPPKRPEVFDGLHGVFHDSLPDGWGLLLAEALFATRRFDRNGNDKRHVLTLSGYLYASHRYPSLGYHSVLGATLHLTRDVREVAQAFRLMVFNVLAHNKDDHARNFSFIHHEDGWRLAPAYDLTFSAGMRNEHATDIAGSGNPGLKQIEQIARQAGIGNWREIVEQVRTATSQWRSLAREWDVAKTRISAIGKALVEIGHRFAA